MAGVLGVALVLVGGCGSGKGGSAAGPTTTHDFGQNSPVTYTAFGDSITVGTGATTSANSYPSVLEQRLRGVEATGRVLNRGVSGETTSEGVGRIGSVLAADRPGFILILEGTNGLDDAQLVENLRTMVRLAKSNKTIPLVGTIPPQFGALAFLIPTITSINLQIRTMAAQESAQLVDIFLAVNDAAFFSDDGFHPNDRDYAAIAEAWFAAILTLR